MAASRLADAWSAARRTLGGARVQSARKGEVVSGLGANTESYMTQSGLKSGGEPTMEDILASIRRIIAEDYAAQSAPQPAPQGHAAQSHPTQTHPTQSHPTQTPAAQAYAPRPQPHHQPQPQPQQTYVRTQVAADVLDLNARADRFRPPMPEVVPVPPPSLLPMPRVTTGIVAPPPSAEPLPQANTARAVSEFSERLGRSFAAAERYQREVQPHEAVAAPAADRAMQTREPVPTMETPAAMAPASAPIASGTVEAVAAAVQSHLEAAIQAAHRNPAPRVAEPQKPAEPAREGAVSLRPEPVGLRATIEARANREPVQPLADKVRDQGGSADPVMKNDPPPAWLVSPRTTNAVAGSFKALQDNKTTQAATPLSEVQATALQDLMTAALRPMLKDWLDQNLPGMVERMITAEIQRVTRGE